MSVAPVYPIAPAVPHSIMPAPAGLSAWFGTLDDNLRFVVRQTPVVAFITDQSGTVAAVMGSHGFVESVRVAGDLDSNGNLFIHAGTDEPTDEQLQRAATTVGRWEMAA